MSTDPLAEFYAEGTWKDRPHFECAHCPFSSLHLDVIRDHVHAAHYRPAPRSKPVTQVILDGAGRPITSRPLTDAERVDLAEQSGEVVTATATSDVDAELDKLGRAELNEIAAALGLDADEYPNKGAVAEAIRAARTAESTSDVDVNEEASA